MEILSQDCKVLMAVFIVCHETVHCSIKILFLYIGILFVILTHSMLTSLATTLVIPFNVHFCFHHPLHT